MEEEEEEVIIVCVGCFWNWEEREMILFQNGRENPGFLTRPGINMELR